MKGTAETELAAALFFLLGEPVPHDPELEKQASVLKERSRDTKQALGKVLELCGTPHTAQQLYLCTKAYSWLGKQYASQAAQCAKAYLASDGWDALPSETRMENGIRIDGSIQNRAGVFLDLGNACAGMGDYEKACSAYEKAYELEPYRVMGAIEASNALIRMGRISEARDFLLLQEKNPYYKPRKFRGVHGDVQYDSFFRESLDRQIERVGRLLKRKM